MADTQKILQQPNFRQFSTATAPDKTAGDAISSIGGMVVNEAVDRRVAVIGGAFDAAQQDVTQKEDAFNTQKKAILAGLANERDAGRVQMYINEYDKLEAGEVQGTMSPTEASLRRESLYRKYGGTFPSLKKAFKEITDGYASGSKVGAADDPVAKARAALIEKSITTGLPVPILVDRERYKMDRELALQRGADSFQQLQFSWNVNTGNHILDLENGMREELLATGGLNSARWEFSIQQRREAVIRDMNLFTMEMGASGAYINSKEDLDALQADVHKSFDGLLAAVKSNDLKTILDRSIQIQQDKGIQAYIDNYGPIGALVPIMGQHAFEFFNQTIPKMFDSMRKHKSMDVIRQAAKAGDKDALMFTSMYDSKAFEGGKYIEGFIKSLGSGGGGGITSNNKHEQTLFDRMSFSLMSETGATAKREDVLKIQMLEGANATFFRSSMPTDNLVLAATAPNIRSMFRNVPEARDVYNKFVGNATSELADLLPRYRLDFPIGFTPDATERGANGVPMYFNSTAESGGRPDRLIFNHDTGQYIPNPGLKNYNAADQLAAMSGNGRRLVTRLNAMYHMYRITAGEAEARRWGANMMVAGGVPDPANMPPEEITDVPEGATVESYDAVLRKAGL